LLQYAQLSKEEVTNEVIIIGDLVQDVLQNLKSTIEGAGATITINIEAESVQGDRIQLMQLLQNLLTNSLKFVEDGRPEILIQVRNENDQAVFSVTDNGIGIAKESRNRIFEIFRREHTAKDYPGTGIGLSICKKIVERHKGKIWIESEPGKGTTFYFTLKENNTVFTG
jgi:signal transduction histidine kinase